MFSILKKIAGIDPKGLTTSHIGVLQAHAYRVLKTHTNAHLAPYDLKSMEWAILGMLFAQSEGLRHAEIAEALGVKKPFVTRMIAQLSTKCLVTTSVDKNDKRARVVLLTTEGKKIVPTIEGKIRRQMRGLVEGVSARDLIGYMRVLEAITRNNEK